MYLTWGFSSLYASVMGLALRGSWPRPLNVGAFLRLVSAISPFKQLHCRNSYGSMAMLHPSTSRRNELLNGHALFGQLLFGARVLYEVL